jgi:hypothetical protein
MKKYIANLKDASGCIRTGYEDRLAGTREECLRDYLYRIRILEGMVEVTEDDVDLVKMDWD